MHPGYTNNANQTTGGGDAVYETSLASPMSQQNHNSPYIFLDMDNGYTDTDTDLTSYLRASSTSYIPETVENPYESLKR